MTIYRLYLISPILIAGLASFFKNRKKAFLVTYGLLTFLFFALRTQYLGSGDSAYYYHLWEKLSVIPLTKDGILTVLAIDIEAGFLLICWFLSHFFPSGQFVFFFAAIVITCGLIVFLSDNSKDFTLATLMINGFGLVGFMLQGTRQAVAIAICLMTLKLVKEKKIFRFLLVVLIASSIHASAMLFVIVYICYGMKINWKSIMLTITAIVALPIILDILTLAANWLMNENYSGGNIEKTSGGIFTMALYVSVCLYCLILRNRCSERDDKIDYMDYSHSFFMMLFCILFFSMRFFYITVFERGSYYFLPFVPLAVSDTYGRFTEKSQSIARTILYAVFLALVVYKSGADSPLVAYNFFWKVIR